MLRVTFLGTAASRPTVGRNVSGLAVQREGELVLFDCGEGTQRQMMRYGTGFGVSAIFVTHTHADHFLGVIGLLRTMGLQGREEEMKIFGPPGSRETLLRAVNLGVDRINFPVHVEEVGPGQGVEYDDYHIHAFEVKHGTPAVGYCLQEHERLGRFDPDLAHSLGVPEGPLFGQLHRGETVEVEGRTISPEDLVGPPRAGRKLVYTGDTAPTRTVVEAARGCDVLIHEATFGAEEQARARQTNHSTAEDAARIAKEAGAGQLFLTHISARYSDDSKPLQVEARKVFSETRVARDGQEIEIRFADEVVA